MTAAGNRPPEATDEPQTAPQLLPHVWVQPTGFGPDMFAGQIVTTDGRAVVYRHNPVRLARHTQDGLDTLGAILLADFLRAGGRL